MQLQSTSEAQPAARLDSRRRLEAERQKLASGTAAPGRSRSRTRTQNRRRRASSHRAAEPGGLIEAPGRSWQARRDAAREELAQLGARAAALKAHEEQRQSEAQVLREKHALLSGSATEAQCPLCGSSLSGHDQHRLLSEMEQQEAQLQCMEQANGEELAALSAQAQALRAEIATADKQLGNLPALQSRKAKLEASLEEAQQAAEALAHVAAASWRNARPGWNAPTSAWTFALSSQNWERNWRRLGYDATAHQDNRRALEQWAPFEEEKGRLVAAEENLRREHEHAAQIAQMHERTSQDCAGVVEQVSTLSDCLKRYDACAEELTVAERELRQARDRETHAGRLLGAARQKLDACQALQETCRVKTAERTLVLTEKAMVEELRVAFSKKGLQAMIIENALPEIEDEANAILFRMTDGRMRVKLDTQRETKDKDVVETLDITVSDEWGARPTSSSPAARPSASISPFG